MVHAAVFARPLNRRKILRFCDDADSTLTPARICADAAERILAEIIALRALLYPGSVLYGCRDGLPLFFRLMEQLECIAFCGAGADAGKGFKCVNEILDGRRILHNTVKLETYMEKSQ